MCAQVFPQVVPQRRNGPAEKPNGEMGRAGPSDERLTRYKRSGRRILRQMPICTSAIVVIVGGWRGTLQRW